MYMYVHAALQPREIPHKEMLVGGHPFMERFPISTMRCCPDYKVAWRVTANSCRVREMTMKSIFLLLLFLTMEEVMGPRPPEHECTTTAHCKKIICSINKLLVIVVVEECSLWDIGDHYAYLN